MLREYFTNRWVIGGFLYLIVFGIACYFYYQHELAPYRQEATDNAALRHQAEQAIAEQKIIDAIANTPSDGVLETDTPFTQQETPLRNSNETSDLEIHTAGSADNTVKVSRYGFGPYPEVPQGFIDSIGLPFWLHPAELLTRRVNPPSLETELMQRVMVKLWKQGHTDVEGAYMENGRVIVNYKNRAYVRYAMKKAPDGKEIRWLKTWSAGSLPAPPWNPNDPYDTGDRDIPPGVELIDLDKVDPSIDPYEFLGLNL